MPSRAVLIAIGITLAYVNTVSSTSHSGCLVGGTWLAEGAVGAAGAGGGEACLRCECRGGALACARRACAAAPDPPPPRCHTRHRKGACCPELHCPDSITSLEHGASARIETDDFSDMSGKHGAVCIDGGTAYSAGSAMRSRVACEQCFCLRGARRCVRPACLAAPPACRARPAAGACCPQRYYCDHSASLTTTPEGDSTRDCYVNGIKVGEGERVPLAERQHNCTQCFCLRGRVQCQHLACAPPLLGCQPILRPGECCPHKYHCHHDKQTDLSAPFSSHKKNSGNSPNSLSFQIHEERLPKGKSDDITPNLLHSVTKINALKNEVSDRIYSTTNKVKRKTNEPDNSSKKPQDAYKFGRLKEASTTDNYVSTTDYDVNTESNTAKEMTSTDQPETMVKILINGTINCTTVLSTSDSVEAINNERKDSTEKQSLPRIPSIDRMDDDFNPDDLITDKYVSGAFDENDSFTVNVTSSLRANTSHPIKGSVISIPKVNLPVDLIGTKNGLKKKKGDYDYDYNEPTLPPSLPNLKIIPFVAADAVVDEEKSNDPPTFPLLEREDKHPIYYPQAEQSQHANRREDVYGSSKYAVYSSVKSGPQYGSMPQLGLPGVSELAASLHEYAVSATLGNRYKGNDKPLTTKPTPSSTLDVEAPEVNLFSPPMETEGGFVPKGPGLIDEYYAVYPSTAAPLHVPHLTTSMQLDTSKEDCISSDGHQVAEGDTISMKCSICACSWGELHCSPRPCLTPPGCERRPPTQDSKDKCCGDISCGTDKRVSTTSTSSSTTEPPIVSAPDDSAERFEEDYEDEDDEGTYLPDITTAESDNITEITTEPNMSSAVFGDTTDKPSENIPESIENNGLTNQSVANITDQLSSIANVVLATQSSSAKPNIAPIHPLEEFLIKRNETLKPTVETKIEDTYETETNESQTHGAQDYDDEEEEEEDEDGGFSFGSVLKLLLSDSYDSTPKPQERKTTPYLMTTREILSSTPTSSTTSTTTTTTTSTTTPRPVTTTQKYVPSTAKSTTTTKKIFTKPTVAPFRPMPQHQLYAPPPKNYYSATSVNKIDHLVLGEATAIRKTSSKPSTMYRPIPTTLRPVTLPPTIRTTTTKKPVTYPNNLEITQPSDKYPSGGREGLKPSGVTQGALPGPGLLKLAGCNIYGKMYRVGKIIAELSSACQECRCTEIGVQCRDLSC